MTEQERTPEQLEAWNQQCYGDAAFPTRIKEVIENPKDGLAMLTDPKMIAMSLLSDAQEEISLSLDERARQTINRAKHVLMTYTQSMER